MIDRSDEVNATRKNVVLYKLELAINEWLFKNPEPAKGYNLRLDMLADLRINHLNAAYDEAISLCNENNID